MSRIIIYKNGNDVKRYKYTQKLMKSFVPTGVKHLCWENCTNACTSKCTKMRDNCEKLINEYDYITLGAQILNDKTGEIERFVVLCCNNFNEDIRKPLTSEEAARIRKLKESLRILYFNAESLDDAHIIQSDLEERGELSNIRGSRPSKAQIEKIKMNKLKRRNIY